MTIQLTEEEQLKSNLSYLEYILSIQKEISTVLGIIEDAIDDRKDSFMFVNPKSQQEEPVPISRAIQYLQDACRTSFAFEFPNSLKEEHELFRNAINHLQKATKLLGFYFGNESFATEKIYEDICHHVLMYEELINIFGERIYVKLHDWMGVESIFSR